MLLASQDASESVSRIKESQQIEHFELCLPIHPEYLIKHQRNCKGLPKPKNVNSNPKHCRIISQESPNYAKESQSEQIAKWGRIDTFLAYSEILNCVILCRLSHIEYLLLSNSAVNFRFHILDRLDISFIIRTVSFPSKSLIIRNLRSFGWRSNLGLDVLSWMLNGIQLEFDQLWQPSGIVKQDSDDSRHINSTNRRYGLFVAIRFGCSLIATRFVTAVTELERKLSRLRWFTRFFHSISVMQMSCVTLKFFFIYLFICLFIYFFGSLLDKLVLWDRLIFHSFAWRICLFT